MIARPALAWALTGLAVAAYSPSSAVLFGQQPSNEPSVPQPSPSAQPPQTLPEPLVPQPPEKNGAKERDPVEVARDVDQAIAKMAAGGTSLQRGQAELLRLPAEPVVKALVDALNNNPGFKAEKVRTAAYGILAVRRGAQFERGYGQLLDGLQDPHGLLPSIKGLAFAPAEKHEAVALRMGDLFTRNELDPEVRAAAVRTLSEMGDASKQYVERIERLFVEPSTDQPLRVATADALFAVGGPARMLDLMPRLDPDGRAIAIGAITRAGYRSQGTYHADAEMRERIRKLVVDSLKDNHRPTRKAALDAMLPMYGDELVVGTTLEDYQVNPALRSALEDFIAAEQDGALKKDAQQTLSQLDDLAKRLMERRPKPTLPPPAEPAPNGSGDGE